jgi:hypothetical protein
MTKALAFVAVSTLSLLLGIRSVRAAEWPVVVELFTSEGCSSCPPADAFLAELASRPEVLALSFHVDYWDRLGRKDPFSSAAATARQWRYAQLLRTDRVYTPQIVVDGQWQAVGSDQSAVEQAIGAARRASAAIPVMLSLDHGQARVVIGSAASGSSGSVVLVGFDRRHVDAVRGGENGGRTLTYVDVVRGISEIGRFGRNGAAMEAPIGWHADRLAVLVEADDGRILGAAVADTP